MTTAIPTGLASYLSRLLSDALLGFLALLSLFMLIAPNVFALGDLGLAILAVAENAIIFVFFAEYASGFALAADKRRFVCNPWRIIDALIIVLAVIAVLPVIPDTLKNSPVLRLLRLGRFALLGTRSGISLTNQSAYKDEPLTAISALSVRSLGVSGIKFNEISWQDGLNRIRNDKPDWLFFSGVSEAQLPAVAEAMRVPIKAVEGLFKSSVPRFDRLERFTTLFVRYPLPMKPDAPLRRTPVLLVGTAENVVVLCRQITDLEQRVETHLHKLDAKTPRMNRAMFALIAEIVRANTEVIEQLELTLGRIEADQPTLGDVVFLSRTFELRADILKVRSSLKHLINTIRDLREGKIPIAGVSSVDSELFRYLADDTGDLFDAIEDLRESLQSLVDLRLNVSSFQMNRVMRLLALLTALALIPATIGGLLGMNVSDAPWSVSLLQVAFGVAFGMSLSLYLFAIKGWLR